MADQMLLVYFNLSLVTSFILLFLVTGIFLVFLLSDAPCLGTLTSDIDLDLLLLFFLFLSDFSRFFCFRSVPASLCDLLSFDIEIPLLLFVGFLAGQKSFGPPLDLTFILFHFDVLLRLILCCLGIPGFSILFSLDTSRLIVLVIVGILYHDQALVLRCTAVSIGLGLHLLAYPLRFPCKVHGLLAIVSCWDGHGPLALYYDGLLILLQLA